MSERTALSQQISSARKLKGITQEELADQAGVTVRTIQRLESGESSPRAFTLKAIAASLGLDFARLAVPADTNLAAGPLATTAGEGLPDLSAIKPANNDSPEVTPGKPADDSSDVSKLSATGHALFNVPPQAPAKHGSMDVFPDDTHPPDVSPGRPSAAPDKLILSKELSDEAGRRDHYFLRLFYLSCFSFVVLPFVHFLLPMYLLKKEKGLSTRNREQARGIILTQVWWVVALHTLMLLTLIVNFVLVTTAPGLHLSYLLMAGLMYLVNLYILLRVYFRLFGGSAETLAVS